MLMFHLVLALPYLLPVSVKMKAIYLHKLVKKLQVFILKWQANSKNWVITVLYAELCAIFHPSICSNAHVLLFIGLIRARGRDFCVRPVTPTSKPIWKMHCVNCVVLIHTHSGSDDDIDTYSKQIASSNILFTPC